MAGLPGAGGGGEQTGRGDRGVECNGEGGGGGGGGAEREPLWQDCGERAGVGSKLGAAIVGSNATVKAGLEKLVSDTGADEVIVVTDTYEHADRLQSYRRVVDVARMIEVKPTVAVGA